jgi:sugar/nucleoside kinase (ribokinase family)
VTKLARADEPALTDALRRDGVAVFSGPSDASTTFENLYPRADMRQRRQRVRSIAVPIESRDLSAAAAAYHFGPLTAHDMDPTLWQATARKGRLVALDVQGLLRHVVDGAVRLRDWPGKADGLAGVDILKADLSEATALSGETDPEPAARRLASYGPKEVLVTFDSDGSVVFADAAVHRIPAYPPPALRDATGCGDTYLAGYVARRLAGDAPAPAARFAAAAASLKLAEAGPFRGTARDVERLLAEASGGP